MRESQRAASSVAVLQGHLTLDGVVVGGTMIVRTVVSPETVAMVIWDDGKREVTFSFRAKEWAALRQTIDDSMSSIEASDDGAKS